jgi:hypothetical protein
MYMLRAFCALVSSIYKSFLRLPLRRPLTVSRVTFFGDGQGVSLSKLSRVTFAVLGFFSIYASRKKNRKRQKLVYLLYKVWTLPEIKRGCQCTSTK